MPGGIETEVCLVHQLLVETRVHSCVVVRNSLVVVRNGLVPVSVDLCTILEQFVKNGFLLIVVNIHTLSLNSTAKTSNKNSC